MSHSFQSRHIGPGDQETKHMLDAVGVGSLEELTSRIVPSAIRLKRELNLPAAQSEYEYRRHMNEVGLRNDLFRSYIGLGYHHCIVPAPIQRNILENPGWYTAYTPYQAEIAQGRLEALLNFQTMVIDLTGLPIANASLLDEGTAAAEAMIMFYNVRSKEVVQRDASFFFVSDQCLPQTIDILRTRSAPLGIELIIGPWKDVEFDNRFFGALLQYPAADGEVCDYSQFTADAAAQGVLVAVAADLLSLALLKPPGEWGADAVVGNTQRFGVPLGFGGPHAAFFATRDEFKRQIPGRIIGVSVDARGKRALRMALQTREQHIKRDKATSNICTAQALLAIMASMYAVYHGPDGIRSIAEQVNRAATALAGGLKQLGYTIVYEDYFDTIKVQLPVPLNITSLKEIAEREGLNFRYIDFQHVGVSLNETVSDEDLNDILKVFAEAAESEPVVVSLSEMKISTPSKLKRSTPFLSHEVFNRFHSETELMRYIKKLENRDLSLTHSMISLGSCTMKLNAASELYPITNPYFADIHPFVPAEQVKGYLEIINGLEQALCEITGFAAVSFQPNSGAQGEYAGLLVIREYHRSRGDHHRNVALIPSSAHGTNPASAVMAGMRVVVVRCDQDGNIDMEDLKSKVNAHREALSCLMVTYPSTHGVYEEGITDITRIIHEAGGQVYMDGANMNAQVGLTNPATIGADVCHLNLHKTFAIPHGGGGPGMGPIGVAQHLVTYLPSHPVVRTGGEQGIPAVSAAPWGSALILLISYGYVRMLGAEGLKKATEYAILNANYLKVRLQNDFPVLYQGRNGMVAHEMILDCREFKRNGSVEVEDIAKRLMDYGFHAPTVSFPVAGTLMIEPTESESLAELDRFCEAMLQIRNEIREVADQIADSKDNVLKNAPHTADAVVSDNWSHSYGREKAAFPLPWVGAAKFWPSVSRVDNAYGDRNLVCSCPPMELYESESVS